MRGYIICYIASQIPYLGKVWFPRSGQNALSQADCSVFKSTVSLEWNDEIAWFFFCMSIEIHENQKLIPKVFGMGMV